MINSINAFNWRNIFIGGIVFITLSSSLLAQQNSVGDRPRHDFWKNTKENKNGYFEITGSDDQIKIVRTFVDLIAKPPKRGSWTQPVKCEFGSKLEKIGSILEFDRRETTIFRKQENYVMLTIWELTGKQEYIPPPKEFLNVTILGTPGNQSLVKTKRASGAVLWKITWFSDKTNHELYVEDYMSSNGEPILHPAEILSMAVNLKCK